MRGEIGKNRSANGAGVLRCADYSDGRRGEELVEDADPATETSLRGLGLGSWGGHAFNCPLSLAAAQTF
jgi:hypothetical protein